MAGSKENPPMTIMGDYPIKVLGYKFGNSFYLLPTLYIIRKSKCSRVSKRKVHFTKRSV